jgi:hypothetical protein
LRRRASEAFCVDKRGPRTPGNARADRPRHSLDTGLPVLDGERLDEAPDVGVEGGVARLVEGLHLLEARVEAERRARLARRREVQVVACVEIIYICICIYIGAFALNLRVDLHAIDATPAG